MGLLTPHIVSILVLLLLLAAPAALSAQDDNLMMVSIAGEPQARTKTVQARIMIEAPPTLVWDTITNYPALKDVLPGYEKSSLIRSQGGGKLIDIAMKVASFLPMYKYRVQVTENKANGQINLNRISGDFKSLKAVYRLTPQQNGEKTLLSYQLDIDPGFNLPGSQAILKNNTLKSLEALERHIEREAGKSVIGQR